MRTIYSHEIRTILSIASVMLFFVIIESLLKSPASLSDEASNTTLKIRGHND